MIECTNKSSFLVAYKTFEWFVSIVKQHVSNDIILLIRFYTIYIYTGFVLWSDNKFLFKLFLCVNAASRHLYFYFTGLSL